MRTETEAGARARACALQATIDERAAAVAAIAAGVLIVYLVLFAQDAQLHALFDDAASRLGYLHEFFHDGRHLAGVPCD